MSIEGAMNFSSERPNFSSLKSQVMSIPKCKFQFGINKCSEHEVNDELWDIDINVFQKTIDQEQIPGRDYILLILTGDYRTQF